MDNIASAAAAPKTQDSLNMFLMIIIKPSYSMFFNMDYL